jgi:membrane associated rhomboid family serine protease
MYAHLSNVRIDLEWAEDAAWRRHHAHPYLTWSDFDDARRKSGLERPWFTYGLIFVCTIMLIVEIGLNGWKFEPLDVNPLIGPSAEALIRAGARDTAKIVEDGQWFRIFTPLLLHAGLVHYAINMAAVWFIGAAIEKSHGILNTVLMFLIPGVGGNILSAIFLPQYISVGASGGIFGLIGGCVADITLNWPILFIRTSEGDANSTRRNLYAIFWIALEIFVNTILGFTVSPLLLFAIISPISQIIKTNLDACSFTSRLLTILAILVGSFMEFAAVGPLSSLCRLGSSELVALHGRKQSSSLFASLA